MRKIAILFCFLVFINFLMAEEQISRLGLHPFYKVKNMKVEDLKKLVTEKAKDIKAGFELAGAGALAEPFIQHAQAAEFQTVEIQPGEKLQWMLYKRGKKLQVKQDLVWVGKKSFTAYKTTLFYQGSLYDFIVPISCGNISLLNVTTVSAPVCSVTVTPRETEPGKSVRISVCNSTNTLKSRVTILNSNGSIVKTLELTPENCSTDLTLNDPGEYTITDEAEGRYGMKTPTPCRATFKLSSAAVLPPPPPPIAGQKIDNKGGQGGPGAAARKSHFLADVGFSQMKDPTNFIFVRIGYQHRFSQSFHLNLLAGPFINISNNFYKTPFTVDLTGSFFISDFWLGGGLGLWLVKTDRGSDNKLDLIVNLGYRLLKKEKWDGSIFFEGRMGDFDTSDHFSDMSRYGLGFRLSF